MQQTKYTRVGVVFETRSIGFVPFKRASSVMEIARSVAGEERRKGVSGVLRHLDVFILGRIYLRVFPSSVFRTAALVSSVRALRPQPGRSKPYAHHDVAFFLVEKLHAFIKPGTDFRVRFNVSRTPVIAGKPKEKTFFGRAYAPADR